MFGSNSTRADSRNRPVSGDVSYSTAYASVVDALAFTAAELKAFSVLNSSTGVFPIRSTALFTSVTPGSSTMSFWI